jgi:hypothetical protein
MVPAHGVCAQEVESALAHAKRLVAQHFCGVTKLQSAPTHDAETDDPYVEVSFEVRGEVKDIRAAYDAFTREWVKAYPIEIREQVRFAFTLV